MDATTFLVLFVMGFFIGLVGRLYYAKLSGTLDSVKRPQPAPKVRYISPKMNEKADDAADEGERRDKKAA